jgi:hypothetical protein
MRADVAIVKKPSNDSPTGFVYNISLQRDGNGVETSYLIRTGTIFPDPADASRRWVVEEAIMAISKADMNYVQSVADPLQLAALGNYQSVGSPKLVGWTLYSVPADDRHFPEGPGEPPIRPDQPLIYTLTAASGPFKDATNIILSYDEASTERQVAIVRGIV